MEQWYVLQTARKKEREAKELFERAVSHDVWEECRILRKRKVFRSGGVLHLAEDLLFPGYLLVRTGRPEALAGELEKSRELPQLVFDGMGRPYGEETAKETVMRRRMGREKAVAVEAADLAFLKHVCGERLQDAMGVTGLVLDGENRIIRADGVLGRYLDRVVKLNLHKRFAIVETPLFNRIQPILFGIRLEQDRLVRD